MRRPSTWIQLLALVLLPVATTGCTPDEGVNEPQAPEYPLNGVYPYEGHWAMDQELIFATDGGSAACGDCRGCPCDPEVSELIIHSKGVAKSCNNVRGNHLVGDPVPWTDCTFENRVIICGDSETSSRTYEYLRVAFSEDLKSAETLQWYSDEFPPDESWQPCPLGFIDGRYISVGHFSRP